MKRVTILVMSLLVAACGRSAEPDYYTLAPVDGALGTAAFLIKVQRPSVPGYLDRPDIVRQGDAYHVQIDESQQWAQPFDVMIEGILAADLRQRLPKCTVMTESGAEIGDPRFLVQLDIQTFNTVSGDKVELKGLLTIVDKTGALPMKSEPIDVTSEGGRSIDSLASGMSGLVGNLADEIVSQLDTAKAKKR